MAPLGYNELIKVCASLQWRHNDHDGVSNHQPQDCLLNRLFRRRSKKTPKLRVTAVCAGNSPGPVNSPHKWSVTPKKFPFDDVIMFSRIKQSFHPIWSVTQIQGSYMHAFLELFFHLKCLLRPLCLASSVLLPLVFVESYVCLGIRRTYDHNHFEMLSKIQWNHCSNDRYLFLKIRKNKDDRC